MGTTIIIFLSHLLTISHHTLTREEVGSSSSSVLSNPSPHVHHEDEDDHGFDANRIISEDSEGFVMSHGDHNHYFFKKDLSPAQIKAAQDHLYGNKHSETSQITTAVNQKNTIMITMETIMRKSTIMALQLSE